MHAIVVHASYWGNTAAIARAIAEGLGPDARAMTTSQATPDVVAAADLVVAGAPIIGFSLPREAMRADIARNPGRGAPPPDLSHISMRAWLATLPAGPRRAAGFETKIWWSPGSSAGAIDKAFRKAGYAQAGAPRKFVVEGKFGPFREGELDAAHAWGAELARG